MNIKIGQYIAGDSILHRLDPRIKIMSMMLLIVTIFLVPINTELQNIIWIGALFLFSLSIVLLSGVRIGQVLQGLKAVVFLMTFTFLIQLFTIQPADETALLDAPMSLRSEEHTSELQSRENLVCRLLLEKKKKKIY